MFGLDRKIIKIKMKSKYLLTDALATYENLNLDYKLPVCLGIDENGKEHFADLVDLGHILIAGSTGSGKSVFNNAVICSLISRYSPDELKLYLTDVKRVEFPGVYKGSPHLISPVDVELDRCFEGLERVAKEKNRRLETITKSGNKNIEEYNSKFPSQKIPYLVTVVDTFSDLAVYYPERLDQVVKDLTADATKAGVHLIMCDSRPSTDVYPNVIKNCFPTKIAFYTTSSSDSAVIIGQAGAEKLQGCGDLLLKKEGQPKLLHLQAPYISDQEVASYVSNTKGKLDYDLGFAKNDKNSLLCKAFIVDLFTKRYMLHIWLKPYLSIAWHRKTDGLTGKLFWVEKFN